MKTMRRIDQPLQFEQPLALKNSLLEIQQHYQQIVKHIDYFDYEVVEIRKQIANEFLAREREKQEDALKRTWPHPTNLIKNSRLKNVEEDLHVDEELHIDSILLLPTKPSIKNK